LGLHVLSGRIVDTEQRKLKQGLKVLITSFAPTIQLTPDQDLVLLGIHEKDRGLIAELLKAHGIDEQQPSPLRQKALACAALPYCGLAITEGERALPSFLDELEVLLNRYGLSDRAPVFRITGCANGCARPYSAELALVGQAIDKYAIFTGGHEEGLRLCELVAERIPRARIASILDVLFALWAEQGLPEERFGDFTHRVGRNEISEIIGKVLAEVVV
jgi:sulfite reductase beta subunit-like hemoprotein